MSKLNNKKVVIFVIVLVALTSFLIATKYFNKLSPQPTPSQPTPSPSITTNTDPEPSLIFGQITRDDRVKHVEWAYRNGKPYEQFALEKDGPKDYVVTFYQPNFRDDARGGGIIVFGVKDNQPKPIWESKEIITLTMPEVLEVRDITGDKKVEIISTWSDGKVSILYLYSWDGKTFKYITPLKKSESKYAPPNSYSPIFGTNRGDIQVKDLDGDSIDEVIISGGVTRDEIGNEIPIESERIYKWNGNEYYLWKEEKIGEEKP
jgi:hypothetical protein